MIRAAAALAFFLLAAVMPTAANDRVALLIGNNNYGAAPLRNAVNDAKDLAEALKEVGFKVIVRENATRKDMIDAVREFGTALEGASAAFFFYAGHAMQFKDRNYLIPIDVAMGSEEDVTFFAIDISQVFDRMDKARTRHNFIVLDACRDNPFGSSFKVSNTGLAQMSAPSGTLIAYATSPGSVAADGFGRNGIYTKNILANIRTPDVPVEIMFKRVREGVERETLKRQTPWDSSSLKGDFAFNSTSAPRPVSAPTAAPAGASTDMTLTIEREFWISVRDSNHVEDIQAYLDKYPSGNFAQLARNRLASLGKPLQVAKAESVMRAAPPPEPKPAPTMPAPATAQPEVAQSQAMAPATAAVPPAAKPVEKPVEKPIVVASAPPTAPPAVTPKVEPLPGREIAPGIREITFADGAIYRGGVKGTNLHGRGEYIAKSFRYEGEFNEGVKHGQGKYVWENGNRYEGPFADDRPNGVGKYFFANGDTYNGEVKNGALTGRGIYVTKGGDTLEGTFVDAKLHGVGIYRYASGDRYEGEVVNGKLQGKGRYYTKDGDRIEAPFMDGSPLGVGTYYFSNGDRYEGDILGSDLTGQGAYFYKTGMKYEGEMRQAHPHGKGVFFFPDGTKFEGRFENGLAHAKGELVKLDGTKVPAEIVDGSVRVIN
jgi:hypothetical protein